MKKMNRWDFAFLLILLLAIFFTNYITVNATYILFSCILVSYLLNNFMHRTRSLCYEDIEIVGVIWSMVTIATYVIKDINFFTFFENTYLDESHIVVDLTLLASGVFLTQLIFKVMGKKKKESVES
jgi:hypothetical protein